MNRLVSLFLFGVLGACAWHAPQTEKAAGHYMIATANSAATEAGADILRQGGSAVDAAVVVETILGLVEPQSSGIGGGAFLVHWDAKRRKLTTYDGRETAPAATTPDQFLGQDGLPLHFSQQVLGGQSVGVPAVMPMLALAHTREGRLPWADLLKPAEQMAEQGFSVSPRLAALTGYFAGLKDDPATFSYFYQPDGTPKPAGTLVANPDYAAAMRALAADPRALNRGPIAEAVAAAAVDARTGERRMTEDDLSAYEPKLRAPICAPYRSYTVCGMGPPSSGGIAVGQILGLLDHFDLAALGPDDPESWHLFAEAMRLAYADRLTHLADADFVDVPVAGLIDARYLAERARLIDPKKAAGEQPAGTPATKKAAFAPQTDISLPSTTHFSIVDGAGDIVSMTASIEGPFGSHIWTSGFLLNNELTDFSAVPERGGQPVANAAAPGKRPLSSMSPTIVFDEDAEPVLVIGSPGGRSIIAYVAKTIIGVVDFGLPIQDAIDLPNILNENGTTKVEDRPDTQALIAALKARGHTVEKAQLTSGLQGILLSGGDMTGGADKRREGTVVEGPVEGRMMKRSWTASFADLFR